MVNSDKITELINWYDKKVEAEPWFVNYPELDKVLFDPMLDALGDNENDIIDYIDNIDNDTFASVQGVYEELLEKFPGGKLEDKFDEWFKKYNYN